MGVHECDGPAVRRGYMSVVTVSSQTLLSGAATAEGHAEYGCMRATPGACPSEKSLVFMACADSCRMFRTSFGGEAGGWASVRVRVRVRVRFRFRV